MSLFSRSKKVTQAVPAPTMPVNADGIPGEDIKEWINARAPSEYDGRLASETTKELQSTLARSQKALEVLKSSMPSDGSAVDAILVQKSEEIQMRINILQGVLSLKNGISISLEHEGKQVNIT